MTDQSLSIWQQCLLALLSGGLLSLSFIDAQYFFVTWVAFIPFLVAINGASLRRSYFLGFLSGLIFCMSAAYWVVDFIMLSKDYDFRLSFVLSLIFWFYSAQLTALIALTFNWLKQRTSVHEFILFPLVIVTFYSAYPMLFPVRLGESQSLFLSAIQATDMTGVYGLDAIIALSNITLLSLIRFILFKQPKQENRACLAAMASLIIWFTYGLFALQTWELKLAQSDTIRMGIVQPNEEPSLEKSKPKPGYSRAYPLEMAMTEALSKAGAEIVIWPEAKYKEYLDWPDVRKAYQNQVQGLNVSLIFQDVEHLPVSTQNSTHQQYNTALMLNNQGELVGQYQKMKRIPFGEYVPLVSDVPILRAWVERFFGKFLNEMAPGTSRQFFEHEKLSIIPLICYEVMFPDFVAEAVTQAQDNLGKLLVGLSSNGWFGATRQPYQHVNASILRAVENRTPLVHVVNNGPSIVALPNGRVMFISDYHQAGAYIVNVPYSSVTQNSFYSHYPNFFLYGLYGLLILMIVWSLRWGRRVF